MHDFGSAFGRPLDTFFRASQFQAHNSWLMREVTLIEGYFIHKPRVVILWLWGSLDSHPKAIPYVKLTRSTEICSPSQRDRHDTNSCGPENIMHNVPCMNLCRLFIHDNFIGPLGLHLLLWSELRWSWPFWPMRDLEMRWSNAFSFICEVTLRVDWLHMISMQENAYKY